MGGTEGQFHGSSGKETPFAERTPEQHRWHRRQNRNTAIFLTSLVTLVSAIVWYSNRPADDGASFDHQQQVAEQEVGALLSQVVLHGSTKVSESSVRGCETGSTNDCTVSEASTYTISDTGEQSAPACKSVEGAVNDHMLNAGFNAVPESRGTDYRAPDTTLFPYTGDVSVIVLSASEYNAGRLQGMTIQPGRCAVVATASIVI